MALLSTIRVLNRLIALHERSLAMYLSYASPTWFRGEGESKRTLDQIVADQTATVDRLGEAILEAGGVVNGSSFPLVFTGYHDLTFDFLLGKLIEWQRRDIAAIDVSVRELPTAPVAKAIAEEALGQAKAHLDMLLELPQSKAPAHA